MPKDKGFFDITDNFLKNAIPDLNGNGKKDLLDLLAFEDAIQNTEKADSYHSRIAEDTCWEDACEEESECDFDSEWPDEEEYDTEIEENEYAWRIYAEDGSKYGLNPKNYETELEYEEALEAAKDISFSYETDTPNNGSMTQARKYACSNPALLDKITATNRTENTSGKVYYRGIAQRRLNAKQVLMDYESGNYYGDEEELKRSRFIIESDSIAAKYLNEHNQFLYTQAIKDHFRLPFPVPDEHNYVECYFEDFLASLIKINPAYAFRIWDWCIETFLPYHEFAPDDRQLNYSVLRDINNFPDDFPDLIINHMIEKESFVEALILECPDAPSQIGLLVSIALHRNETKIAKNIMECAFANPHSDTLEKIDFISSCIDYCSDYEDKETMERFKSDIFPIVYTQTDVRITCEIDNWMKEMNQYTEETEDSDEKYAYSGKNEWRLKYKEPCENAGAPNPLFFTNEEEYKNKLNEQKYGWRKYASNALGINPSDYETRDEYNQAVNEKSAEKSKEEAKKILSDSSAMRIYRFCKVGIHYPLKPYLYYLTGDLPLSVGDTVVVPCGMNNEELIGVVVSIGECFGFSFPYPIERLKKVIRIDHTCTEEKNRYNK